MMWFRTFIVLAFLNYVVAVPPNDRCVDATTLKLGEQVMGDNSDANFDYNSQGICGSRSDRRAVWYKIIGTGLEVTVSVCTNNEAVTDFGVFSQCNSQMCSGSPPQQDTPSNCAEGEAVTYTFWAEDGEDYYVHVRSDIDSDGIGSNFMIKYTTAAPPPVVVPPNDRCVDAITLTEGKEVMGDNSNANFDFFNPGICGSRSDRRALWYQIIEAGLEVTVSVCTNNQAVTDFGVFFQCNSGMCFGHPPLQHIPSNCAEGENVTYTFLAEDGEDYYVHVRSDIDSDGIGSMFTIKYTTAAAPPVAVVPPNDRCVLATTLTEGEEVSGDNSDANFDFNSQGICGSRSDRRAVWYKIIGAGLEVTVSVCTNNQAVTDFGVFFQCNSQMCLGHPPQQDTPSNCADGEAVTYTFLAEDGEDYYVHVRSDIDSDGIGSKFTIKYTTLAGPPVAVVPPNDRCVFATTLTEGEEVSGDNSGANFDFNSQGICGSRSDRRAVWYQIIGTGLEVTVSVCTNNQAVTDFGVFSECNSEMCLGHPHPQDTPSNCADGEAVTYTFLTDDGDYYYVHVRSDIDSDGIGSKFTIKYTTTAPPPVVVPPNDRCIDAITLTKGEEVTGDTSGANFDYDSQGICGYRSDLRAVWYQIIGAGLEVTVSVCTNNEVVTDFGVFFQCNSQICLGSRSQPDILSNCAEEEAVTYTFLAEDGEDYYVHVRAHIDDDGIGSNFTIKYTELETEESDDDEEEESDAPSASGTETIEDPEENTSSASIVSVAVAVGAGPLAALWM